MPAPPRSILITGASSGIGAALAQSYAAPDVRLALTGRDPARLAEVAQGCRAQGATVLAEAVDVTDRAALGAFIAQAEAAAPLDLVIANAGISLRLDGLDELEAQTRATFATNIDGVLNTLLPAIACMRPRRRGQLAIVASLAGFRGLPGAVAYAATKAAVRSYGEGLRGLLAPEGIGVSVICPGYVTTRMTARNRFPMPFLMSVERATGIIRQGLARNRSRIAFPWPMYAGVWLLMALPDRLVDAFMRRMPRK